MQRWRFGTSVPDRLPEFALYLRSLRQAQGIFGVNTEVADRALKLGMAEQDLHRPQIAGPFVDQCHLDPPQAVRAVGRATQADTLDPIADQPGILPRADVIVAADPAREHIVCQTTAAMGQPCNQALAGLFSQLELHRLARFLLEDGRVMASRRVDDQRANAELREIAAAQLAIDRQVEYGEIAYLTSALQGEADRPYVLGLERRLRREPAPANGPKLSLTTSQVAWPKAIRSVCKTRLAEADGNRTHRPLSAGHWF